MTDQGLELHVSTGGGEGKGRENLFLKIFEREDVDEVVLDERQVDQFPGGE